LPKHPATLYDPLNPAFRGVAKCCSEASIKRRSHALLGFAALLAISSAATYFALQSQERDTIAIPIAANTFRPEPSVPYEPMFDSKQTLMSRLADAVDLAIDFATLGEYGLEPVGRTPRACETRPNRSPRRHAARTRGGRGASSAFSADGAA